MTPERFHLEHGVCWLINNLFKQLQQFHKKKVKYIFLNVINKTGVSEVMPRVELMLIKLKKTK